MEIYNEIKRHRLCFYYKVGILPVQRRESAIGRMKQKTARPDCNFESLL